jgi:hypothetical protein
VKIITLAFSNFQIQKFSNNHASTNRIFAEGIYRSCGGVLVLPIGITPAHILQLEPLVPGGL